MLYSRLLRPYLFRWDAEEAHEFALRSARVLARSRWLCGLIRAAVRPKPMPVRALGLTFPNPIGLAAGMDKNAVAPLAWWAFGFGFVELGTVTPLSQGGNDQPRMFRYVDAAAVVNRMGFNNRGAAAVAARLAAQAKAGLRPPFPVGVSVGKNKVTPDERTVDDYQSAAATLAPHADFVAINVSSPNTTGLRSLQTGPWMSQLVTAVRAVSGPKPVLVKVAPELVGDPLNEVLDAVLTAGAAGVIATNTLATGGKNGLEVGGLSGRPLRDISPRNVEAIRKRVGDGVTVIGVGGIEDADSARRMLDAGATLLQLYTALVYHGPFLPVTISRGLGARSGR
jgi:dihydroorotate dehydrogenase